MPGNSARASAPMANTTTCSFLMEPSFVTATERVSSPGPPRPVLPTSQSIGSNGHTGSSGHDGAFRTILVALGSRRTTLGAAVLLEVQPGTQWYIPGTERSEFPVRPWYLNASEPQSRDPRCLPVALRCAAPCRRGRTGLAGRRPPRRRPVVADLGL